MKKIFIIFVCITGISSVSCKNELNLAPVSEISNTSFWKTESDAEGANVGMYTALRGESSSNLFMWGESRSDAMGPNVGSPVFQNWDQNSLTPTNSAAIFTGAPTSWGGMYSLVHTCNLILHYVPGISFTNETKKNNILAQAHAMRAFAYFVMAKTWGDLPLITEPTIDLGNVQRERSPVADIFKLIKEDIDAAVNLFPDNTFRNGRDMWSLPSTNALKADVYLWTGKRMNGGDADFTTALNALNAIDGVDVSLLPNFGDVFNYDNKANKEILFAIRWSYEESPGGTMYAYMYMLSNFIPPSVDAETVAAIEPTAGAPFWSPSAIARNKFTADDTRKKASMIELYEQGPGGTKTFYAAVVSKYNGAVIAGQRYFIDDYIIYRYADVLLMKAEAKNALSQDPSFEINEVRKRAYGANYASHVYANAGKVQNDVAILDERFRELMFEGKRWWDLVRFGKAFELVPSLQTQAGKDYLLLFPIAPSTLSLETKVKQNPGYGN
ncbi:RagB/SusD family nutrient uptake outer membrane protein [Chitinophaga sp. MM2321]|uniref:RagB/SusD family nutrient uptake outer membrane protein n=1 Tax=Chitinophaga sp. MM2321 TaxID=3137178 RepID=UPI0032D57716